MRTRMTRLFVLAALTLAVGAQVAAFAERAEACRFMRLTADERPACCALAASDRFTRPGGDCCKNLVVDEATPATSSDLFHPVPPSLVNAIAALVLAAPSYDQAGALPVHAVERPPPLPPPTETVVLLI